MKKSLLVFILLLLVSMVVLSPVYASPTALSVDPPSIIDETKVAGTTFTININVTDVTDLYTFDFRLTYSTAVLTATEVTMGSFFPPDSMEWRKEIDDTVGYVRYLVSMPLGTPPGQGVSGNGTLAIINFTVDSYGGSALDLCDTKLSDSYAEPILHEVYDGYFSNKILGDVNGDGIVDIFDIGAVSAHWYPGPPVGPLGYDPAADINGDGAVDIFDIGIVSAHWGESV